MDENDEDFLHGKNRLAVLSLEYISIRPSRQTRPHSRQTTFTSTVLSPLNTQFKDIRHKKLNSNTEAMSDGLNQARAMRIAEVLTQYRSFLQQVAASQVNVPPNQAQARGYVLLRQYHQQNQVMAALPPNTSILNSLKNDDETKRQLQKILIDVSARRFKAYKLVSNVAAVMRWINNRVEVLKGQQPGSQHAAALAQLDTVLQQDLAAMTNQRAYDNLRAKDIQLGHWMDEMPSLQVLLSYIQAN